MKIVAPALTLLLLGVGCSPRQPEQLTQQQQDKIKSEVRAAGDSVMARFVGGDWAGAIHHFYANTPHWVMFNADGTQWDYQTTDRLVADSVNAIARYRYATLHRDFWVVNKDLVLCAWVISDTAVTKSGDTVVYAQHPYTAVFQRIAGQWKLVWSHDSGVPVVQKASAGRVRGKA